ncbi:hypothetical protein AN958_02336 [Leucoagaricus sp. SymC.cos]|nr:hypothetical protein AN958_02336 [Leucoagaricus sp. SymC.cos]
MSRSRILHSLFGFQTNPVTSLLILVYFVVFVGVIISDPVQHAPKDTGELNLEQAYRDLHEITARPRPFISHANDNVRAYILGRLQNIAQNVSHVHVLEDLSSNATWIEEDFAISFEGANILVKVDGANPDFAERGGVLFSAHYDSVSTGLGATDDAIGVVSLMAFVEYLSKVRTARTAIFNINNGEEDGLHGAHLLYEHPWSKVTDSFINLEGAGAGGRPLVFRSTSLAPVSAFKNKDVPRPHGNVLSADAFARGLVRSGTDYEVYAKGVNAETAMEGVDFAFYQRRSKYHTRYDSVPHADGGKDSIWAMLQSVHGAGLSLLNNAETHVENGKPQPPVYFDLYGRSFVLFTQKGMFAFNVAMLILGPLSLLFLHHIPSFESSPPSEGQNQQPPTLAQRLLSPFRRRPSFKFNLRVRGSSWGKSWRWLKFWAIFIFTIVFQVILVATVLSAYRYIVQSQPFIVLISELTLPFLVIIFFTHIPFKGEGPRYPNQQRLTMLYQLYILAWILLVVATVLLQKLQIGGSYFLTGWYIFVYLAAVVGSTERIFRHGKLAKSQKRPATPVRADSPEEHGLQDQPVLSSSPNDVSSAKTQDADPDKKPKPHERTPLITRKPPTEHQQDIGSAGWWIFQLLLVIPIPVILVAHLMMIFMAALSQTLSDGSSPLVVYAGSAALSLLMVFPVVPFAFKIHRSIIIFAISIFTITTIYIWSAFPFTIDVPLKVFFQQSVELEFSGTPATQRILHATSALTGVPSFIQSHVVSQLPSSWSSNANLTCSPESDGERSGVTTCQFTGQNTTLFGLFINLQVDQKSVQPKHW